MSTSSSEFDYIQKLILNHAAIVLEAGKEYLIESRLTPLAHREGFNSIQELVKNLRVQQYNGLHRKVVEAMTTNETSFFRDLNPFEALKNTILPELIAKRASQRQLNIWCAASSSGQEPYTVAMLIREHFPQLINWNIKFIASDLSIEMLNRALEGRYNQFEINRGLPATFLVKYFHKHGLGWQLKEDIRHMVEFCEINLADTWPSLPAMDIILMRNVMIYFNIETKKIILSKISRLMKPDSYLLLGGGETTLHITDAFQCVQIDKTICYRLANL